MAKRDWTVTTAKWGAVAALGVVSAAGIVWSMGRDAGARPGIARPEQRVERREGSAAMRAEEGPRDVAGAEPANRAVEPPQEAPAAQKAVAPAQAAAVRLNPNRASKPELELLPGVGPALADRIIAERARAPFARLEDLGRVRGIGPKTLDRLREHVTFE